MIAEAYMSLKSVVQSLLDVHTTIQSGDCDAEKDVSELTNTKTRSEYEVNVMKVEHQQMLAEAAKRSDVTPEEEEDAEKRGEAITNATEEVKKLEDQIQTTQSALAELNEQMKTSNLSAASLKAIQDKANEGENNTQDHIILPTTQEIKTQVDKQLANVGRVIETVPTSNPVREEAEELKTSIETKFGVVLNDNSGQTVAQLTLTLKQLDVDLLHLRDLDIYDSAAKMEL